MARKQRKIKTESKNGGGGNDDIVMDVGSGNSDNNSDHAMVGDEVTSGNVVMQQGGRSGGSDDDDDEIIREIPVFLSPELSDQIQLVQFPLQPNKHPTAPEAVRVKPRHCMMEIDLETPTNIQFNGLYHMPNRTFQSQTIPVSTHMALGKMIEVGSSDSDGGNGQKIMGLHLVPLSRMTQMRPSFSHIDEAVEASMSTTEDELRKQQQESQNGSTDRKSITFRKKESERQELARKSSYGYKKASEAAEGWHSMEVYDEESLQAKLIMEKVACPVEHQSRDLLDVEALEKEHTHASANKKIPGTSLNATYLNTLNYLPPRDDFGTTNSTEIISALDNSTNEQSSLALVVTKLVKLMRQGMPIPFSLLRAEFPRPSSKGGGISDTTMCVALGSCAVLVRGNWCLNSRLLSYSNAMTRARTFLLCLFQSMGIVHRERLVKVFANENASDEIMKGGSDNDNNNDDSERVTPEVIAFLLEQLGEKTRGGWVLKVADDVRFAEQHPQTTLVHLQYWSKQIESFRPMIETYRADV
jgi:hypothetical protein